MKHLMISLLGALAIAGAVQAAEPRAATAQASPAGGDMSTTPDEARKAELNDHRCLRHTGTRISTRTDSRKQRTCSNGAIGRAYNREDLDRTGEVNIAEALRKLDPSIH